MSGGTISTSETRLEALVLPSSAFGVTVPLIGGMARVPANLIDYFNFESHAHTETQGGKGGVEQSNTTYSYTVSALMGICHGRGYVGQIWKGKQVYSGGWSAASVLRQVDTYTVPGAGAMTKTLTHGTTAIGSPLITYAGPQWKQILSEGADYSLVGGVVTILKDAWRGKALSMGFQYGNGSYSHAGLTELGMSAATGDVAQTVPAWITADMPSHARNYPGMVYAHAQDYDLGNSASVEPHSFEVLGFGAYRYGSTKPDCNIAEFVGWVLTNAYVGAGLPSDALEISSWIDYCAAAGFLMSPALTAQMRAGDLLQRACELTNSRVVQSYDRIRVIPLADEEVTGNGVTYTPDTTPRYDLTDDFMIGNPPFNRTLKIPEDRYNHVKVEYNDRANYYNKSIVDATDDGDIALNKLRTKATTSAPWICDAGVARLVAQTIMQRELNIAGGGSCRLPWAFVLLDAGDLVRVLDPILGDDFWPVRVTQLDEDEYGFLSCTVEDWPLGTASPTQYTTEVPGGYLHNYNAAPGSVDAPIIFEGPAELAGATGIELYVGARGSDPDYGGCHVWVSYDGTEYKQLGTIYGHSRYGTLQNSVTSGSSVFRVTGLGSRVELRSGSIDDAQNLETLCFVGGASPEFFAHQAVTLVSSGTWDLNVPVRGAYDTKAAAHAAAVPFARIDDQLVASGWLDAGLIGQTVYVKCLAFNKYGRAVQSLASATAYTYTVLGSQFGVLGVPYRVVSRGTSDTEGPVPSGLYDVRTGQTLVAGSTGYRVVTISREAPFKVLSSTAYNVSAGGAVPGNMAAALNALSNDVVVVVFAHQSSKANRLSSGLDQAMYRCGASRSVYGSPEFKTEGAYLLVGIPGQGEGSGAELYNGDVDSSTNAWCDLYFEVGPKGLNCSGSTSTPRSLRDFSYTGDFDASAATVLVARGACSKNGSTISASGAAAWGDGDCYSRDGFTGGAFASGVPQQADKAFMFGLNQDPVSDQNYSSIDWAIYCRGDGALYIYEGGTSRGAFGTYTAGDVLAVVYDGFNVVYLKNGTVLRTVPNQPDNLKLFFDSAFHDDGTLAYCQFGPMSGVNGIGTNQLLDESVDSIITTTEDIYTGTVPGVSGGVTILNCDTTYTNDTDGDVTVDVQCSWSATVVGAGTGSNIVEAYINVMVLNGAGAYQYTIGEINYEEPVPPVSSGQTARYTASRTLTAIIPAGYKVNATINNALTNSGNNGGSTVTLRDGVLKMIAIKK